MLWSTIRIALRSIARNPMRAFLTVLGVVIGVAAVIAMLTIGQGSSRQVSDSVAALGGNTLILRPGRAVMGPGGREGARPFSLRDGEALSELPVIAEVSPVQTSFQTAVYGNANAPTNITGTDSAYLTVFNWQILRGRAFLPAEERAGAAVCLIGETVRQTLFGNTDPTGEAIRIRNLSCRVVGLLQAKGASGFGTDQDDIIIMPVRTLLRRITGSQDVTTFALSLAPGVSAERGIREITALMRERRRIGPDDEDDFTVTDMKEIASMLNSINAVLAGLLSSVAAVSLVVGGIGIMNIMLVSVTERTREIGIRLAVGATAGQVLMQFLVEAVVLSLIGGLIGIALGLGLAAIGARVMAIPFAPDPAVVALAFFFSAAVGVAFGYLPARRAARMDPIEALRHQ